MEPYTLIVTEKPAAAGRIALALDKEGKPMRLSLKGVPFFEARRDRKIVIVPALGHLYTVAAQAAGSRAFPILDYKWVPRFEAERGTARIKKWLQAIASLAQEADLFIDACDYDIEGSIIGYCILRYACGGKEGVAKRMKYSTLTDEELQASYDAPLEHLDFGLIDAGLARHEIDWLYGINISRALTKANRKTSGSFAILSTGRVQGPTLRFLAARERNIKRHVPKPFWAVNAFVKIQGQHFEATHEKGTFQTIEEADAIAQKTSGKTGLVASVDSRESLYPPPPPFDLGALQNEAYRIFGYAPIKTSAVAQRLYLDALISYPRTSSQKLPRSIGYKKILSHLVQIEEYTAMAEELLAKPVLTPLEGKKLDPAHPAIYPTGKIPRSPLLGAERNIYNLVVRRFMAVFIESSIRENVVFSLDIGGENFVLRDSRIIQEGWVRVYKPFVHMQNKVFPQIRQGDTVFGERITVKKESAKPPARYNPATVLRKMEQGKIGTKATRAGIIQTLYDRKYIREERMVVTNLGLEVTDVLRKYCPEVVSVEFTRQLEGKMALVQEGIMTKTQILEEAISALKSIATSLVENELAIGEQLGRAVTQAKLQERVIGMCPMCKTGRLIVQYSKKTGKRFVGCTNYFNRTCKAAFPLPQTGILKPKGKQCSSCGWSTVQVWRNKHSWNLCFNPGCPSKKMPDVQ